MIWDAGENYNVVTIFMISANKLLRLCNLCFNVLFLNELKGLFNFPAMFFFYYNCIQFIVLLLNEWMRHLYSALLCIVVHPKHFTIIWGGLSSTTTSVQHPLGWCDGSYSTTAPERSQHTSYRWRGASDRANQVDGDYWEAMIDKGQWREFGQDTGVTPLLFTMSVMGFLMTTESQDLGLTSHPKDGALLTV